MFLVVVNFIKSKRKVNYFITEEVWKIKKKEDSFNLCWKIFKSNVYFGPNIFCENWGTISMMLNSL